MSGFHGCIHGCVRRGLSLAEVVLGAFILLLGMVFISTMIGNVSQYESSLEQRTIANQLAQYQMDQVLKMPTESLVAGASGYFSDAGLTQYSYSIPPPTPIDYEMSRFFLTVTAPDNRSVTYSGVVSSTYGYGLAIVPGSPNMAYFVDYTTNGLYRVPINNPHQTALTESPPMSNGGVPAGLSYAPSGNPMSGLWAGNANPACTQRIAHYDPGSNSWDSAASPYNGMSEYTAGMGNVCGGVAFQNAPVPWGNGHWPCLMYTDRALHGAWCFYSSSDWKGVVTTEPGTCSLAEPRAIACAQDRWGAWVCDASNHCLRYFATWDPRPFTSDLYRPPTSGPPMGRLRAIACDDSGSQVWVIDSARIYMMHVGAPFNDPDAPRQPYPDPTSVSWNSALLPITGAGTANPADIPTGLAWDGASDYTPPPSGQPGTHHLWISTLHGSLYEIDDTLLQPVPPLVTGQTYYP
jgi:hypothetical protein